MSALTLVNASVVQHDAPLRHARVVERGHLDRPQSGVDRRVVVCGGGVRWVVRGWLSQQRTERRSVTSGEIRG